MNELNLKNQIYIGSNNRQSLVDLTIPENFNGKLILFVHGYMGYKDWGCWNQVEQFYTRLGFGFSKFNMTHNGVTIENPTEFLDLEAFGENNYSKELYDLKAILNWLEGKITPLPEIYLIGHSRGGGISLLATSDTRIHKISAWAAISSIEKRFPTGTELKVWKTQGKRYIVNGRTNQKMPNNYSQYEDYIENSDKLSIENACLNSKKPTLLIHGDQDNSVAIEESRNIASWLKTRVFEVEEANHTFGATEPWDKKEMPEHLQKVCELTLNFLFID